MRTATLAITIVTIILVVLGINLFFQAEAVEHHGYKVDVKEGRSGCLSCHDDVIAKTIPRQFASFGNFTKPMEEANSSRYQLRNRAG